MRRRFAIVFKDGGSDRLEAENLLDACQQASELDNVVAIVDDFRVMSYRDFTCEEEAIRKHAQRRMLAEHLIDAFTQGATRHSEIESVLLKFKELGV